MNSAKTSCPEDYARATDPARGISIAVGTSSTLEDTIPINQAAWKRAGIYVKYDIIKSKYYSTVLSPKNPNDISSSGWASDWQNASTVIPELFASFGGFDMTKAEDAKDPAYPAIVAKMNKALNTLDRKAQAKLWKELDVQIAKEFWYIPTVFGKAQEVWGSGLGGVYFWQPQGTPAYRSIWIK
jgi:peptide/nickel transport system substrate-binding protein